MGKAIIFLGFFKTLPNSLHFRRWFLGHQTGVGGHIMLTLPFEKNGRVSSSGLQMVCSALWHKDPCQGPAIHYGSHRLASSLPDSSGLHEVLWPNVSQSAYSSARFIPWHFNSKAFDQPLIYSWTLTDSSDLVSLGWKSSCISGSSCTLWHLDGAPSSGGISMLIHLSHL